MTLAERLTGLRKDRKMSLDQLARAIGAPLPSVQSWVYSTKHRGPCWPGPEYLQALADFFFPEASCRLSALLEGVEAQRRREPVSAAIPAERR